MPYNLVEPLISTSFSSLQFSNHLFFHQWTHTRKLASNIFSAFQFRTWIEQVLHGELDSVVSILDQAASKKEGENKILMPELFFRYTLSSFSKMAFSTDVKCLNGNVECLTEPVEFSQSFDFVQDVINKRFSNPAWQFTEKLTEEGKVSQEPFHASFSSSLTSRSSRSLTCELFLFCFLAFLRE